MKNIIIICILSLLLSSCSIQSTIPHDTVDTTTIASIDSSVEYSESSIESVRETVYDPTSTVDKKALTIPFVKLDITPNDSWSSPIEKEIDANDPSFWDNVIEQRLPQEFILLWGNDSFKVEWGTDNSQNDSTWYVITEVCHLGKYWLLPESVTLLEVTFRYLTTGDTLMLGYSTCGEHSWHGRTVWYYINNDGIWQLIHTPYEDGVEYTFREDNGQIKYNKENCAYVIAMSMIDMINAYTDDNQFYYEDGILEFQDGEIIYEIESSKTINDMYLTVKQGIFKELRDKYGCQSIGELYKILKNEAAS